MTEARRFIDITGTECNGSTAHLPVGEDAIFATIPKGTRVLTCETLNVRKG